MDSIMSYQVEKANGTHTSVSLDTPKAEVTLINVVAILDCGSLYAHRIEHLHSQSDFLDPIHRAEAMRRMLGVIGAEDTIDGFVRQKTCSDVSMRKMILKARDLWRLQIKRAGISAPENTMSFPPNLESPDDVCLAGFMIVVPGTVVGLYTETTPLYDTVGLLQHARPTAFYFYYTPAIGNSLSLDEAYSALQVLRGTV